MDNFPSFTSSDNFNQSLSIGGQSQDFSMKSRKTDSKKSERQKTFPDQYVQEPGAKTFSKSRKIGQQPAQSHHKHDYFDHMNQDDPELGDEVQPGSIGPNQQKKIKGETTEVISDMPSGKPIRMEEESERKESKQGLSLLGEIFQRIRLSNGEESVFYEYDPNQQEEARLLNDSLREMFSKKCRIASNGTSEIDGLDKIAEKAGDYVSFQFSEPKLEDYTVVEILGKGLHGLVIKMRSKYNFNAVIKLFEKKDREEFLNEIIILQNVEKAKELKILKTRREEAGDYDSWDHFSYQYFERDEYFGIFVKEGLGSLLDFKEYLKERKKDDDNFELSAQELLVLTWSLLDACYCLHKINHCHRDIKPANIVLNAKTFLPELIDYSLASKISEAKGVVGTPGYRMEDFPNMKDSLEKDLRNRLILNDYFALGKTILELAFPDFGFKSLKDIKEKLKRLEKSKEKKTIAKVLEICLFENIESKEVFVLGSQSQYLNGMNPAEKELYKGLQIDYDRFSRTKSHSQLRTKHFKKFEAFMKKKWSLSQNNTESELQKISSKIISREFQDQTNAETEKKTPEFDEEIKMLCDEEQEIKRSFRTDPEKARMKCYEVIDKLASRGYPTIDTQIYSTLLSVLYLTDSLDNAILFGKQIALLPAVEENWLFKNNLAFLETKKEQEEEGHFSQDRYLKDIGYFTEKHKDYFIDDFEQILSSATCYCEIGKGNFVQKPLEEDLFSWNDENEIILTFFKMTLQNPRSYFFMNYCFILASIMDKYISEEIRESIKQFVFDMNHRKRIRVLRLVKLSPKERALFAVLSFCKIFENVDCTESDLLEFFNEEANQIIGLKEVLQANIEEDENSFRDFLFEQQITFAMVGFIICYNLEYDLTAPDIGALTGPDSPSAEWNDPSRVTIVKYNRRFDPQKCLDSIMSWIIESPQKEDYFIPIDLMEGTSYEIYCLLIFGKRVKDLILHHRFVGLKGCVLGINPQEDFFSIFAVKMNFRLSDDDDMESIDELFAESNLDKLSNLEDLTVELWGYHNEKLSLKMLAKVIEQLSALQLSSLDIRMVKQIPITDKGFTLILDLIQSQSRLDYLALQFNLSLITSKSIELLANVIINLQELQQLRLSFRHCSEIERKSIEALLLKIKRLPKLERVDLRFIACTHVRNLVKPMNLPYELEIDLAITNGYIPAELDEDTDDDDEYCDYLRGVN